MNDCPELNKSGGKGISTREKLNVHYHIVDVDLSKGRDEFQSHKLPETYNELRILACPGAFEMKFNSKNADVIPIASGQLLVIERYCIRELFIANTAGAGTAYIWLAGRDPPKTRSE